MRKVALFAGYGNERAAREPGGEELARAICKETARVLREWGCETIETGPARGEERSPRAGAAIEAADVAVEIHAGSAAGATPHTAEAFYSIFDRGPGRLLAEGILKQLRQIGFRDRGAKSITNSEGQDYHESIRMLRMTAIVARLTFIKGPTGTVHMEAAALAIAKGIFENISSAMPLPGETAEGELLPAIPLPGEAAEGELLPAIPLPGEAAEGELLPAIPLPGETVEGELLPAIPLPGEAAEGELPPAAPVPEEALEGKTSPDTAAGKKGAGKKAAASPSRSAQRRDEVVQGIQETLNARYGAALSPDGIFGPLTWEALTKALQTELNRQFGRDLAEDGVFGPETRAAAVNVRNGDQGELVYLIQAALYGKGYKHAPPDGVFGPKTEIMVKAFQNDNRIKMDGIAGPETQALLFSR